MLFIIPVVALGFFVVIGLFEAAQIGSGTLVVEARSVYGSRSVPITALATVGGVTHSTPFNLSLNTGLYTVTFSHLNWFQTAVPESVNVLGGKTVYAVGVYAPIPDLVSVDQGGFNVTSVRAEHGVTPVVWLNAGASVVQLESNSFHAILNPGENYTRVFPSVGSVNVSILGTSATMEISVV